MKPFLNPNFLQLCIALSVLGILALGVTIGTRSGGAVPVIAPIFDGGQPPPAQAEPIERTLVLGSYDSAFLAGDLEFATQEMISFRADTSPQLDLDIMATNVASPNPTTPDQTNWQGLLAVLAILVLIGVSFRIPLRRTIN